MWLNRASLCCHVQPERPQHVDYALCYPQLKAPLRKNNILACKQSNKGVMQCRSTRTQLFALTPNREKALLHMDMLRAHEEMLAHAKHNNANLGGKCCTHTLVTLSSRARCRWSVSATRLSRSAWLS